MLASAIIALLPADSFAQVSQNPFMQMFGLNDQGATTSDSDDADNAEPEPVDPLIGLANTINQMNMNRMKAAGGTTYRPIPPATGSSSYKPIPSSDNISPQVYFGPANVAGEAGNLYRQACQGKSFPRTSPQAGKCLSWRATGEQTAAALAKPGMSMAPYQSGTPTPTGNKNGFARNSSAGGGFPTDPSGKECISSPTALPPIRTPSTKENAEGQNQYGSYYDIVFKYKVDNICPSSVNFTWSFGSGSKSSRTLPPHGQTFVQCQKNLHRCDGRLSYRASWP